MTEVEPRRSSVTGHLFLRRDLLGFVPCRALLLATLSCLALPSFAQFAAAAPAQAAPAQASSPQIITIPVQTNTPTNSQSGPDWNRNSTSQDNSTRANDRNSSDSETESSRRDATRPDIPTEFQSLVAQTVGSNLPIFGSSVFNGAPSTFAPIGNAQVPSDYEIGTGDEIRISATGQLNQQSSFIVDRAGTITIPEVGTLTVAGIRFSDLKPFLQQQIGRVYRNFVLNVTLGQLRSIQIYVLGETRRPGSYTVSSLSSLVNALFVSGGVRPQGSLRHIELRRGGQTVTDLDLYDLLLRGDKSKDVKLQPGDIIFVPAAGPQVAVVGSVTDPAIYELRDETTVKQLLQLANGLTSTATGTSARIESIYNHLQRGIRDINLQSAGDTSLQNGDIVTVAAISDQYKDAVTLRGNVTYPGRYVWHAGMHISDVITSRESLLTRSYFRARNALGAPTLGYLPDQNRAFSDQNRTSPDLNRTLPDQGRVAVSTAPGANEANTATPGTLARASSGNRADAPTPTTATTANANGSGTTVGDALTQNNSTFSPVNDIVLSAPDVDLAYAVIERLDPVTLTTSLFPFNLGAMLSGDPAQNLNLEPGDVITVFSKADIRVPQSQQTRFVRLEGEFTGAGVYSVKPGETLRQLVARAGGLTPDAFLYGSEFTRQSTRRVEAQRLREYADTLEGQINNQVSADVAGSVDPTSTAMTANVAAASAREAVARIRRMQPSGRIVLKLTPDAAGINAVPDIALEDGDRFIVPRQPTSVAVAGEVYNASSFLYLPNLQVRHYLRDAGGPQRTADEKRVFLVRADGSVVSRQYSNVEKATILPGDTIVVPPILTRRNVLRNIVAISQALSAVSFPLSLLALVR